ncbi:hypothetical protein [Aquimarina sp. SS2-1]|uniref:hypothetical protein n=1 Tax=Aquimarina besae TaxID=3342247 RepID=UPI00366F87CC
MQRILFSISLVVFLGSCKETQVIAQNTFANQENILLVEYDAISRGYFFAVKITNDSITKFKDRSKQESVSKPCSKKGWSEIISSLKKLELEKISDLKAPSDKRTFDGAAHAQLKITTTKETYTSTSFDDGNPPQELKPLVNTILSLTESIE